MATRNQKEVEVQLQKDMEAIKNQEKVTITIPRDRMNPQKHVWVSVNGQEYYLAVGKPIQVPKVVADVWQDSYNRTLAAEEAMEANFEL